MYLIFLYFFTFIFSETTISEDSIKVKTDFFKDLKFKPVELELNDILTRQPLKKYTGQNSYITQNQIDSIKLVAKNYTPSEISLQDTIVIETTKGTLKLKFFLNAAPKHCLNFKKLANSGYYDNTTFHRVIKSFMIQGGDILSRDSNRDNDGMGGPDWNIDQEFNSIKHNRGVLSMARGASPNSAGSQFFICVKDAYWLDGQYTVFGEVIEDIQVIDFIADTPTDYTVAKTKCMDKIPSDADESTWIKLTDPKSGNDLFSKIPKGRNKTDYKREMMKHLRSDNPTASIVIKKIRVKDGVNSKE